MKNRRPHHWLQFHFHFFIIRRIDDPTIGAKFTFTFSWSVHSWHREIEKWWEESTQPPWVWLVFAFTFALSLASLFTFTFSLLLAWVLTFNFHLQIGQHLHHRFEHPNFTFGDKSHLSLPSHFTFFMLVQHCWYYFGWKGEELSSLVGFSPPHLEMDLTFFTLSFLCFFCVASNI